VRACLSGLWIWLLFGSKLSPVRDLSAVERLPHSGYSIQDVEGNAMPGTMGAGSEEVC
jgi:hypothetical protein